LDELIIAGEMQESSKKSVLRVVGPPSLNVANVLNAPQVTQSDDFESQESTDDIMGRLGGRTG